MLGEYNGIPLLLGSIGGDVVKIGASSSSLRRGERRRCGSTGLCSLMIVGNAPGVLFLVVR